MDVRSTSTNSKPKPARRDHRELTDFLVFAVSLILVYRTFVAEPFSVPTGSMGLTLLGRHKTTVCPHCGSPIEVSASQEVQRSRSSTTTPVTSGCCPNCRHSVDLTNASTNFGDRVCVLKHPPDGYHRWDLAVFKCPDEPRVCYVKRIVGMPGETVRIRRGNVEILDPTTESFVLMPKPPKVIDEVAVPLYDDRHRLANVPPPWRSDREGSWNTLPNGFEVAASSDGVARLTYRPSSESSSPTPVTDWLAYNTGGAGWTQAYRKEVFDRVDDLIVDLRVHPSKRCRRFGVEYQSEAGSFLVAVDVIRRHVLLTRDGADLAVVPCRRNDSTQLRAAFVDGQVVVWIDGKVVIRKPGSMPCPEPQIGQQFPPPTISIWADGPGTRATDLVLRRDIYYRQSSFCSDEEEVREGNRRLRSPGDFAVDPTVGWTLRDDEYVLLGDNSAQSADSRHWNVSRTVQQNAILGKVVARIWPLDRMDWTLAREREGPIR